jgi:hypothetical protein
MCCGKNRIQFSRPPRPIAATIPAVRRARAIFEYVGRTNLIVKGSATGKYYRFERPGVRIEVDPRDRPSVAAVPMLRQLRG